MAHKDNTCFEILRPDLKTNQKTKIKQNKGKRKEEEGESGRGPTPSSTRYISSRCEHQRPALLLITASILLFSSLLFCVFHFFPYFLNFGCFPFLTFSPFSSHLLWNRWNESFVLFINQLMICNVIYMICFCVLVPLNFYVLLFAVKSMLKMWLLILISKESSSSQLIFVGFLLFFVVFSLFRW